MTTTSNRGPRAAAANRAALVDAAREVFAERGVEGPVSAIARRAGVGQASLYRHFPTPQSLAFAVFAENLAQVEALAKEPATTLRDVIDLVTLQIEGSAAVLSYVARADDPHVRDLEARLAVALEPHVVAARESGVLDPSVTTPDVLLGIGMIAALVARTPAADRHARAEAAWALLMRGLGSR